MNHSDAYRLIKTQFTTLSTGGTLGQTPCGPDGPDGEPIGRCDASGACLADEVECPSGNDDCILGTSLCCVEATSRPENC